VSRAKKARSRERRRAAAAPPSGPAKPRIEAARRRVALTKVGIVGIAIVGFGVALGFSRLSYAGHSKKQLQPLAAPTRYVKIVRQNLLEAGIVAPAEAPPGAATASS
jgi:hypothetical protein